ncbi:MAG: AraC family transcriptional regulator [Bacilli bacterium]|nr:AraC family transcriptional regulator [Bacilli bacterium]
MNPTSFDASLFLDLSVLEAGREICISRKAIDFTPKSYSLIHYVYAGKGRFVYKDKEYRLKAGDAFLIPAGESAHYQAEPENPWSYFWIGVGGAKAGMILAHAGFTETSPVLHDGHDAWRSHFAAIYDSYFTLGTFGLKALSEAYALFDDMSQSKEKASPEMEKGHVQAAKVFIQNNFQFPITIQDIATSVGVSPNYLANLFADQGEESPKRYLTRVRMEVAARLLTSADSASIADVGKAVGYPSPLHFSKSFRSYYGVSPLHYQHHGG